MKTVKNNRGIFGVTHYLNGTVRTNAIQELGGDHVLSFEFGMAQIRIGAHGANVVEALLLLVFQFGIRMRVKRCQDESIVSPAARMMWHADLVLAASGPALDEKRTIGALEDEASLLACVTGPRSRIVPSRTQLFTNRFIVK